jgi:hypothetical protein
MSDKEESQEDGGSVVARKCTVDAVVAVILLVVGLVVVFEARHLGSGWTSDGPGAGYFPFYIGLIVCISSLGILYQSTLGKSRDTGAFVDGQQLKQVLSVLLPAIVYVFAIVFLGLYVASAIYIALFMIVLGKYSPARSVVIGVVVNAIFFLMFEVWFKVPLYKGMLDPLRALGY